MCHMLCVRSCTVEHTGHNTFREWCSQTCSGRNLLVILHPLVCDCNSIQAGIDGYCVTCIVWGAANIQKYQCQAKAAATRRTLLV